MFKVVKKNNFLKNNFNKVLYFHTSQIQKNNKDDKTNNLNKVFNDVFKNNNNNVVEEKEIRNEMVEENKLEFVNEQLDRVESSENGENESEVDDDIAEYMQEGVYYPNYVRKYPKYTEFSKGVKRITYSEDNAYFEEFRRKGETSSEDEITIRREKVEVNEEGEVVTKKLDESLMKFKDKFKNTIKKKKKEEEVIAEYKDSKLIRKAHPLKQLEDLNREDFSASEKEVRSDSDMEADDQNVRASEKEIAPHLSERMRRQAFERLQYGDYDLREEIYKDAPFFEKPISVQHSTILQETKKLMPKRENQFLDYFDSSRQSKLDVNDVFDFFMNDNYYPNKLEKFIATQKPEVNDNQEGEEKMDDLDNYYTKEQQLEFDFRIETLFFNYNKKAVNHQAQQFVKIAGRNPTDEENNQFVKRALDLAVEYTLDLSSKINVTHHPEALEEQYKHALNLAFEKIKQYNPTLEKVEIDDDGYIPPFNRNLVVAEAQLNAEETEFDKQWEVVQTLRKGKLPTYLSFYLSIYDLRFRKFYPEKARKWVEFAKTPRGYFGRDAQWHTITKKELKQLKVPEKHIPTLHTELFQPHNPTLDEDLKKGYRFGFLQSEIDSIENLSPKLKELLTFNYAYPSEIKSFRIYNEINLWKRHPLDTGSAEIQVAVFTIRMDLMLKHLFKHNKDYKTRHALQKLTVRRKTMMTYLKRQNVRRYFEVLYHLKIPDYGDLHWNTTWPN